jgi:hypothetical protein
MLQRIAPSDLSGLANSCVPLSMQVCGLLLSGVKMWAHSEVRDFGASYGSSRVEIELMSSGG